MGGKTKGNRLWDFTVLAVVLMFLALGLMFIANLSGCAVGFDANGDAFPCIRLDDPAPVAEGLKTVGGVIGGAFGGPAGVSAGTAIGGLLGTGLTAFFAKRTTRARDAAFDEGVARGAGIPTATSTRVAPKGESAASV
jgi:hypothetical protein